MSSGIEDPNFFNEVVERQFLTTITHGSVKSIHEGLGLLEEEYAVEFKQAVHANNLAQCRAELLDIINVCLRTIAYIDERNRNDG